MNESHEKAQEKGSQNVQKAAESASATIQREVEAHDPSKHNVGAGFGTLAMLAPPVINFLKGLGENQLQALVAYVGTRFTSPFLAQQQNTGR